MHFNEQLPIRPQEVWDNTQERLILWTNLKNQMCLSVEKLQIFKKSVGLTLSWSSFIHFVAVILGRNGMKPHYRLEMSCCPKWRSSSSSRLKVGGVKTHSTFLHSALDRNSGQWMKERDTQKQAAELALKGGQARGEELSQWGPLSGGAPTLKGFSSAASSSD